MKFKSFLFLCLLGSGALSFVILHWTPDVSPLPFGEIVIGRVDATGHESLYELGPRTEHWTPLEKVSRFFLASIVLSEDSRFYKHIGLDFREIWESLLLNIEKRKFVRGASTITQQVVRLSFLSREKTLERKVQEALGAISLELYLDKEEILEWYINLLPFGHRQIGIEEASRFYFDSSPEVLSLEQSILLTLLLPAPSAYSPHLKSKELPKSMHWKYKNIAQALHTQGYINQQQYQNTLAVGNFGSPILED